MASSRWLRLIAAEKRENIEFREIYRYSSNAKKKPFSVAFCQLSNVPRNMLDHNWLQGPLNVLEK